MAIRFHPSNIDSCSIAVGRVVPNLLANPPVLRVKLEINPLLHTALGVRRYILRPALRNRKRDRRVRVRWPERSLHPARHGW